MRSVGRSRCRRKLGVKCSKSGSKLSDSDVTRSFSRDSVLSSITPTDYNLSVESRSATIRVCRADLVAHCGGSRGSERMSVAGTQRSKWELAAESIVVKLRWFGVVMGYILVQTRTGLHDPWAVRAFLALGAGFAALDLAFWWMGEVFPQALASLCVADGVGIHCACSAITTPA